MIRNISYLAGILSVAMVFALGRTTGLNEAHPDRIAGGFYGVEAVRTHGSVEMGMYGTKIADCDFIKGAALGFIWNGSEWTSRDVNFVFVTPSTKPRGVGDDYFNRWRWEYASMNLVEEVAVVVFHNCSGELRPTTIGYFDIKGYKSNDD